MSDEPDPNIVDGITPNGENAFTSPRLGIALVIKPKLAAGEMDTWLKDVRFEDGMSIASQRLALFFGAVRASIFVHCTDKPTILTMKSIDAERAQWYGSKLIGVYTRYTALDPN